jgi:hypothetical protein
LVECFAGFFADSLFDLAADGFALTEDFERDFALADFAPFDLLPMRPALTVVCVREWRARATRSGLFQPMARSARNFAGISSIPSP